MSSRTALTRAMLLLSMICVIPAMAEAQGRGRGRERGDDGGDRNRASAPAPAGSTVGASASVNVGGVTLSVDMATQIRSYYASRPASNVEALPPGIRRNLARGKPLPPGIAKKQAPSELVSRVHVREGYHLVEVGADVFLVEVATNVIHDILMDVIR